MKQELLIGGTPLLQLTRFCPNGVLLGKVEACNLTGSSKDRAALAIVSDAWQTGQLLPGGTIIEATSGNMGISLAALAARFGYHCILVMPEGMSPQRQQCMRRYGAQVVLTPTEAGMAGAVETAQTLAEQISGSFLPRQFSNPANALSHYQGTGAEIWEQCNGQMDALVACVGTGGTLTGAGRFLKEQNPYIQIVAVEPAESPVLSGGKPGLHGIQGIGAGFVPELLERSLVDQILSVSTRQALQAMDRLAKTEGLLCGISSGAAAQAGLLLAAQGLRVAAILPDTGLRYLS